MKLRVGSLSLQTSKKENAALGEAQRGKRQFVIKQFAGR
jgi:hypothetical protein